MRKVCKILIIGDSGVGKTTLIHRFIDEEYRSDFKATLGADMSSKEFEIDGKLVEAQIWDTAGTERFRSISASHYRGADACILVYDITCYSSFEHLGQWMKDVINLAGIDNPNVFPFVLFANKSDIDDERQVTLEGAEKWAHEKGMEHFLVSAKTGENVNKGFVRALELFVENGNPNITTMRINLNEKKSSCC